MELAYRKEHIILCAANDNITRSGKVKFLGLSITKIIKVQFARFVKNGEDQLISLVKSGLQ